jgi:hypothetical protein
MNFFPAPNKHKLTVYQAYLVKTTAGRELRVLFKGYVGRVNRLWFLNLDPPYDDCYLKARHIKEITAL